MKCILKCAQCLMACFERFIRFLTYNAYIMVALTGKNFCLAAKEAFETIWANAMRFSLVQGIGGAFIIVGKFCITAVTVMIFYYIITDVSYFSKDLYSPVFPCGVKFILNRSCLSSRMESQSYLCLSTVWLAMLFCSVSSTTKI